MKKPFPLSLRFAHLAVWSPLLVILFVIFSIPEGPNETILGIPGSIAMPAILIVLPILLGLLVFLTGAWRLAVVLLTAVLFSIPFLSESENRSEDSREIIFPANFNTFPAGTDVFCNEIKLGTIPFKTTVGELLKKVPPRATPPGQTWFVDGPTPVYTELPWDGFIVERRKERFRLDPVQGYGSFDAKSKYWWSFDFQGTKAISTFNGAEMRDVGGSDSYRPVEFISTYYPSNRVHFDLLLNILKDDGEKPTPEWIAHVSKYSKLLRKELHFEDKREGDSYEKVLNSVARHRYGLSDSPTPAECDRAMDLILKQVKDESSIGDAWYLREGAFGRSSECGDPMLERAVRQFGDACREPLARRWKNCRQDDEVRKVWIYLIGKHPFPELFDSMVCSYASRPQGFLELMSFKDPRLVGLLKTLIDRVDEPFDGPPDRFRKKCQSLIYVDNPMLGPMIREFLTRAIPIVYEYKAEEILNPYIKNQIQFKYADPGELKHWVESLPINGKYKTQSLQQLSYALSEKNPMPKDSLDYWSVYDEDKPRLTATGLKRRLDDNPGKTFDDWIAETYEKKPEEEREKYRDIILRRLLRIDTPEAEELVKRFWNDPKYRTPLLCIVANYGSNYYNSSTVYINENDTQVVVETASTSLIGKATTIVRANQTASARTRWSGSQKFRLPGTFLELDRTEYNIAESWRLPETMPAYMVPLLAEVKESESTPEIFPPIAFALRSVETDDAMELLRRWSESEKKELKRVARESLEILTLRMELIKNRRKLYEELISGKITPDQILPSPNPWVWDGKKYVSAGSSPETRL